MRYKTTIRPPGIDCMPQCTVILSFEPQDEYSLYGYFTTQEPISAADMWHFDIVECPIGEDAPRVGQIRIDRCAQSKVELQEGRTAKVTRWSRFNYSEFCPCTLGQFGKLMPYTDANWAAYVEGRK